jgi:hypothetical protein
VLYAAKPTTNEGILITEIRTKLRAIYADPYSECELPIAPPIAPLDPIDPGYHRRALFDAGSVNLRHFLEQASKSPRLRKHHPQENISVRFTLSILTSGPENPLMRVETEIWSSNDASPTMTSQE